MAAANILQLYFFATEDFVKVRTIALERLLIAGTNLDGFNLVNCGQFANFAKLSYYMV